MNTRFLPVLAGAMLAGFVTVRPAMAQALSAPPTVFQFDRMPAPAGSASGVEPASVPAMTQPLDMTAAIGLAVNWHPSVKHAVGFLLQSADNIEVARAGYYPQVRAGVNAEMRNEEIERYGTRRVQKATVSASQMLYDFGKVASGVDHAQALQVAARARVLLAVDQLARDTAHAVIEVQRYQRLTQVADEQITGVHAIAELARERRALGASTLSDETQASAREDAAQATRLQMQAQLQRWRTGLSHLIGQARVAEVASDVPAVLGNACRAPQPNWLMLPSVMVAEAERSAAQASLAQADAQQLPTLSLDGSVGRGLNAQSRTNHRNDAAIMLNVSAPLYQGGGLQASKRAAGHALGAANAAVTHARLNASQGLMDAQSQAMGFAQRIGVLDGRTDSIRQTRDLYRQQYLDLGTRSLLDLLNAEQEYHQARIEYVNNLHDLHRLQVDCLYNTGELRNAFALSQSLAAGVELQP